MFGQNTNKITRKNFEEVEIWLNDKSENGKSLVGLGKNGFIFENNEEQYIYRIEFFKYPVFSEKNKPYFDKLKNEGIDPIDTGTNFVVFKRKATDGDYTLFPDTEKKIEHYKRMLRGTVIRYIVCAVFLAVNFYRAMTVLQEIKEALEPAPMLLTNFDSHLFFSVVWIAIAIALFVIDIPVRKKIKSLKA